MRDTLKIAWVYWGGKLKAMDDKLKQYIAKENI
jgi:hypothetical protein